MASEMIRLEGDIKSIFNGVLGYLDDESNLLYYMVSEVATGITGYRYLYDVIDEMKNVYDGKDLEERINDIQELINNYKQLEYLHYICKSDT